MKAVVRHFGIGVCVLSVARILVKEYDIALWVSYRIKLTSICEILLEQAHTVREFIVSKRLHRNRIVEVSHNSLV